MELIRASDGGIVRLTNERVAKILRDHEEMAGNMNAIPGALASPDALTGSRPDPDVSLYYKLRDDTGYGTKYVCVVVCESNDDRFVLTAYLTGRVR